jgi:hypothetical protein
MIAATVRNPSMIPERSFDIAMFRQFLSGEKDVLSSESAGDLLGELYAFASNVLLQGFHGAAGKLVSDLQVFKSPIEGVNALAEGLTQKFSGLERDFFRKSTQEAILTAAGPQDGRGFPDIVSGLKRFLTKRGAAAFLELFLLLHVFNIALFATQEAPAAQKKHSMMVSIRALERLCGDIVRSVSTDLRLDQKVEQLSSDRRIGEAVINTIKHRLLIYTDEL